jgi:hypothetical protein
MISRYVKSEEKAEKNALQARAELWHSRTPTKFPVSEVKVGGTC